MAAKLSEWEKKHQRHMAQMERYVQRLYEAAARDAARAANGVKLGEKLFSWADYPLAKRIMKRVTENLRERLEAALQDSVMRSWDLSEEKNDALAMKVCGLKSAEEAAELGSKTITRYLKHNDKAREAFMTRKTGGLNLSGKVWKLTETFEDEVALAMDCALREGTPANRLATKMKQYLNEPNKLFRRVRDQFGVLRLSKAARAYHPGRGVYRSSYMNARRLAVTETNMAYRTADHARWRGLDFVVGIEIRLSNNHTCRGFKGRFVDICDDLQGKYPKDFKFTGWHPHCRCHAVPILKTPEEVAEDNTRIMQGKEPVPASDSPEAVKELPKAFTDWTKRNADRIEAARERGTLPYFLKDNEDSYREDVAGIFAERKKQIVNKLKMALAPYERRAFVSFEPFSPMIINKLSKIANNRQKQRLLEEIFEDGTFIEEHTVNGVSTKLHPGHKMNGKWVETLAMSHNLNKHGIPVAFLPEEESVTCADAIIKVRGKWKISDFKYTVSVKWNTIQDDIEKAYKQAQMAVIKFQNADLGQLKEALEYLRRKGIKFGDMIVINRYGDVLELTNRDLRSGKYYKKMRGFL